MGKSDGNSLGFPSSNPFPNSVSAPKGLPPAGGVGYQGLGPGRTGAASKPPGGDISGIDYLRNDPILQLFGQFGYMGPLYHQRRRELADLYNPNREIRGPSAEEFAANVARRERQGNGFGALVGEGYTNNTDLAAQLGGKAAAGQTVRRPLGLF